MKGTRAESEKDFVCVHTTHSDHEAHLIRIGLEGRGITVILQRKADAEAPNSFTHKVEIFVPAKDREQAVRIISRSNP